MRCPALTSCCMPYELQTPGIRSSPAASCQHDQGTPSPAVNTTSTRAYTQHEQTLTNSTKYTKVINIFYPQRVRSLSRHISTQKAAIILQGFHGLYLSHLFSQFHSPFSSHALKAIPFHHSSQSSNQFHSLFL